jgi:hypothetical protein
MWEIASFFCKSSPKRVHVWQIFKKLTLFGNNWLQKEEGLPYFIYTLLLNLSSPSFLHFSSSPDLLISFSLLIPPPPIPRPRPHNLSQGNRSLYAKSLKVGFSFWISSPLVARLRNMHVLVFGKNRMLNLNLNLSSVGKIKIQLGCKLFCGWSITVAYVFSVYALLEGPVENLFSYVLYSRVFAAD